MPQFKKDYLDMFLSVVRKYMHLRGSLSQSELAKLLKVGGATVSRFLNKKTVDVDAQLVAQIIAVLNIPTEEVIDFVNEDYVDRFEKLVKFLKNDQKEIKIDESYLQNELSDERFFSIKDKLEQLSPQQFELLSEFLNMDTEEREFIVDIGSALFRHISEKKKKKNQPK